MTSDSWPKPFSLLLVALAFAGWSFLGCGRGGMPQTVPVSGRVTFDGQAPPGPGTIYFLPHEAAQGFPMRPATGDFDKEGSYTVKTFDPGDGLMPGKYRMHVECWETPPNMEGKPVKSFVPTKYQSAESSGFNVEITTDMRSKVLNLDVVTK